MDWKNWYRGLNRAEREAYAQRAGTTTKYIEIHLMQRHRCPRPDLMARLADATLGRVSYEDLVMFFFAKNAA